MKKPHQGLSRRQRDAARADAEETAILQALEAGEAEIAARRTFGSYVVEVAIEMSNKLGNGTPDEKAISDILDWALQEIPIADTRRGEGLRADLIGIVCDRASIPLKVQTRLTMQTIFEMAEERAGPSVAELTAELHERLGLS